MQFENDHHRETHEKVEQYLGELFEDTTYDPENGHFYVGYGSTVLEISVEAWQAAVTDVFGFFDGKTLTARVSMRKEDACV